jgi:steroid 5-alpha reductase family enzyme
MSILFIIAKKYNDISIVDRGWAGGFMLLALMTFFARSGASERALLVTMLTGVWGIRLTGHIVSRNWGKGEDPRYTAMKATWGNSATIKSFFYVFMLQGLLILIIAYPVMLINLTSIGRLTWFDYVGFIVWLVGFFFEVVGDYQLQRFVQNSANKGNILDTGLWRYTRHPNYFGESLIWWGMFLLALPVAYGFTTIMSPLTITVLLLFVSGVPLTEKSLEANPAFANYKEKTSSFFPWLPQQ